MSMMSNKVKGLLPGASPDEVVERESIWCVVAIEWLLKCLNHLQYERKALAGGCFHLCRDAW